MSRIDELWQDQMEAEQAQYMAEMEQQYAERDMEPHKCNGWAERMYEQADMLRKERREMMP